MLERVVDAPHQIKGMPAVTISTVHGLSVEPDTHYQIHNTELEIMLPDQQAEQLLQVIQKAAHTGNPGDGSGVVLRIEMAVKIRTGERST